MISAHRIVAGALKTASGSPCWMTPPSSMIIISWPSWIASAGSVAAGGRIGSASGGVSAFSSTKARVLAEALDDAIATYLEKGRLPSRKVNVIDNRGSTFYLALYWAQALAAQDEDAELKARFATVAEKLAAAEAQITEELLAALQEALDALEEVAAEDAASQHHFPAVVALGDLVLRLAGEGAGAAPDAGSGVHCQFGRLGLQLCECCKVFFTVPSRLIGHRVRLYDDHLTLLIGSTPLMRLTRGRAHKNGNRGHAVHCRHVIHALHRKLIS